MDATRLRLTPTLEILGGKKKKNKDGHKGRKPKSNNQKTLAEELVFRNRSEYDTRSSGFLALK